MLSHSSPSLEIRRDAHALACISNDCDCDELSYLDLKKEEERLELERVTQENGGEQQ